MKTKSPVFKIAIASRDVESFLAECGTAEWYAYDTGERVMTEEGPDAEAVLLVEPTPRQVSSEEIPIPQ